MYAKFGKKKFFTLLLVLITAFCMTGTALAAPVLKVGGISGDNVVSKSGSNAAWAAEIACYGTLDPTFNITSLSGSGFDMTAAGASTTLKLRVDNNWAITPDTTTLSGSGSFSGAGPFKLSGPATVGNTMTLKLDGSNDGDVFFSDPVVIALKFVEGKLQPVLDKTSLNFTTGAPATQVATVTGLKAGEFTYNNPTLDSLEVRDSSGVVASWNDMTFKTDKDARTITVAGSPTQESSKTFTVRMTSPEGTVADTTLTVNATKGGSGASIAVTPQIVRFYLSDPSTTATVSVNTTPANLQLQSLNVVPSTWNGLTLTADASTKKITISGHPSAGAVTSVDVTAETAAGDKLTTAFTLVALDQSSIDKIDETYIGIWDYGNVRMKARELIYYKGASANTGYNAGGKYDLVFFSSKVIEGKDITVLVKDPTDGNFVEVPRLTVAQIPKEGWYYVDKTIQPSPYSASPRGTGSSFGWYRDDVDTALDTMSIVVNSQPFMDGNYTFRIEYAYEGEYGPQSNVQEFTLRCTNPVNAGSGGGGCDAGIGLAVFGLLAAGGFAVARKRRG